MQVAKIGPNSSNFAALISHASTERDLMEVKSYMEAAGINPNKNILKSTINALTRFGNYEEAKHVVCNSKLPTEETLELKISLGVVLAYHKQNVNSLTTFSETKSYLKILDCQSVLRLTDQLLLEGEVTTSLQILEELKGCGTWLSAFYLILRFCMEKNQFEISFALIREGLQTFSVEEKDKLIREVFARFATSSAPNINFGMDLLQAVRIENNQQMERLSWDFLVTACGLSNDPEVVKFMRCLCETFPILCL